MMIENNYVDIGYIKDLDTLKSAINTEDFTKRSVRDSLESTPHTDTRTIFGLWDMFTDGQSASNEDIIRRYYSFIEEAISKVEKHYGYMFCELRSLCIINLLSGGRIESHKDDDDYRGGKNIALYNKCHRIHIVCKTNDNVLFDINGEKRNLKEGAIVEVNNLNTHRVFNNGYTDRVHIVLDLLPHKGRYRENLGSLPDYVYKEH